MAVDVRFTLATGAGTGTPQRFQGKVAFHTVVPTNGEFVANRLDVLGDEFHGGGTLMKTDVSECVKP